MLSAMKCPFCDEPATALPTRGYDGEIIDCPRDGVVMVARGVRHRLDGMNQLARDFALARAKTKVVPELNSRDL
jgi:hypothetical protein